MRWTPGIGRLAGISSLVLSALAAAAARGYHDAPTQVGVRLSEWKVELTQSQVAPGKVQFAITNAGIIPHAFEIEGGGVEKETKVIQPGATDTLTLSLQPGSYEVYCPVGEDSHKKLGMDAHLTVGAPAATTRGSGKYGSAGAPVTTESHDMGDKMEKMEGKTEAPVLTVEHSIQVRGGGPVIQILPGPFPFPDSAAPILQQFGNEREGLEAQVQNGPYSNKIAPISGTFTFSAWDLGATRDSVDGVAKFTTQDGARWELVIDRVQTKDVPHHPRFGGVILGLFYHGATGVHTPLVPTINSAVALWAFGHLYKDGGLVTNDAMVHVMLLSHTRRDGDYALECWDCSKNPIDELQLQVLPGQGEPPFDAPGGFLFVNWEKSGSRTPAG